MHRFVTERLTKDHDNIGRVLSLMRVQLDFLTVENIEGLSLLSTATSYLVNFPGVLHHPLEEVMFDALLVSEPSTSEMRGRLVREHGELAIAAADLTARIGLQQLDQDSVLSDLQHLGAGYIMAYGDHIRFEEEVVLPKALEVLSEQQWKDIRAKFVQNEDPLFNRQRLSLYDNLYDAMMGDAGQLRGPIN